MYRVFRGSSSSSLLPTFCRGRSRLQPLRPGTKKKNVLSLSSLETTGYTSQVPRNYWNAPSNTSSGAKHHQHQVSLRLYTSTATTTCSSSAPSSSSFVPHEYSSIAEPDPTLFPSSSSALEQTAAITDHNDDDDKTQKQPRDADDAQLRADMRVMGSLLGHVVKQHNGEEIFASIERMRSLAKEWRSLKKKRDGGTDASDKNAADAATAVFEELGGAASQLTNQELFVVSRAFTHFLAIANAAESHHRSRRLQQTRSMTSDGGTSTNDNTKKCYPPTALYPKSDSCGGVLVDLLDAGHSAEEIFNALRTQTTELVLTAHPTQVNRRTVLEKHQRLQEILTRADACRASGAGSLYEQDEWNTALEREIASLWLSDEVSRYKPTPSQEAEKGTLVLETVLWKAVPQFLRKLSSCAEQVLGQGPLPLSASPITFASWMGGDRDGNPNVVPDITRRVCLENRKKAASLFLRDLQTLSNQLSLTTCSPTFREQRAGMEFAREPYRAHLQPMIEKMQATKDWAKRQLEQLDSSAISTTGGRTTTVTDEDAIYLSRDELMQDLLCVHESLVETGNGLIAEGFLTDVIRNVSAFGLTLIPLDVRQESDRHCEAMDAITRYLGLGRYSQWDETAKINWLTNQIASKRPLLRPGVWNNDDAAEGDDNNIFSPTTVDTLETFQMIAEQPPDSLGAYVISQATTASDVLSVLLLQLNAGVKRPLPVVPLFETLDDLDGANATMRSLFSQPVYMGTIAGKQQVMIGYSDSAKDAGRLAASWAQYQTQRALAQTAKQFNVELTFFHGKGGTVGRGGNPQTFLAIMSHAPDTINGRFRVTEQGEMIHQNFGYGDRAERTMDIYTAAVLAEKLTKRPTPNEKWERTMRALAENSCKAYRDIVRGDPRFVPYFRTATPETELANLNIGSRPAKRKASGGVESLRAIPWIFSWMQTRLCLPTWLGVGEAIGQALESGDDEQATVLREMYREWDSFRTVIDLVEMVLSKSEPEIAKHYEDLLVTDPDAKELGSHMRKVHAEAERSILDLTQHDALASNNKILTRALSVRNPYVDCLNVLQAETLKRIRQQQEQSNGKGDDVDVVDKVLRDAMMTTINGIAQGMGNSG